MINGPTLILASESPWRARLMQNAGVPVEIRPPRLDEDAMKRALLAEGCSYRDLAITLAEAKAMKISVSHDGRYVLGGDQVLICENAHFDKPKDTDDAVRQLQSLQGRSHELITAAVILRDGQRQWFDVQTARLRMRPLSDSQIRAYLEVAGNKALTSVGAYQMEGLGMHILEHIDGDPFVIQGLPMLSLLAYLRRIELVHLC